MTSQEQEELRNLQQKLVELAFEFWLEEKMTKERNKV